MQSVTHPISPNVFPPALHFFFLHFFFWWSSLNCKHCLAKRRRREKKSHTLIFRWSALSLDHGGHSPWHSFVNLMQHHSIYFHLGLRTLFAEVTGELKHFSTSQIFSVRLRSEQWKWDLMLPEPLFRDLRTMDPGIAVLEYAMMG